MSRHPFSKDLIGGDCELCGAPVESEIHDVINFVAYTYIADAFYEEDDFPRTFGALQRPTPKDT